jgi:hypothetical protein
MFLKLDIAKIFDSISWAYLPEVLQKLGFESNWRNWISITLSTSSSRILLNGTPAHPLSMKGGFARGTHLAHVVHLGHGPLQKNLIKASERGLLQPFCPRGTGIKASQYVGATAIFIKPTSNDIVSLKSILDIFGQALCLKTNLQKSDFFPIACNDIDLGAILEGFPATVKEFPCRYLGLPLHTRKLRKIDFQALLDNVGGKLAGWKGKLMTKVC